MERWQLGTSLLFKFVLREGALQDRPGPSVALEAGVLFPNVPYTGDLGASLAAIVSERWSAATVHLNLLLERNRQGNFDVVPGVIIEGPDRWAIRPVGEFLVDWDSGGTTTASFLLGAIWRIGQALSLDAAVRVEPHSGGAIVEGRMGFTWALAL
jgi:hypothetical protein